MLLFLLTKSTLVFVTSLIIFLCLTAIVTLLIIIILLTNDCWWHLDNYVHLTEEINFSDFISLKNEKDNSDLDQIVINEETNCEDEGSIDKTILNNRDLSLNNSSKTVRSSIVHFDGKNGRTVHELEKKSKAKNYPVLL
uniref:Uncharacterized protein n=1 Tax=Strongyloides venezuelensis TaxID=75913 RepID=A0A0K0F1E3_STRVS